MRARIALLYACFFISGASALVYEIVWHRMLTLVFGLSTMSVAAVLSAFLAGLAVGARLFGSPVDRAGNVVRLYAGIEVAIGLGGVLTGFLVGPLMEAFTAIHRAVEPGWFASNLIRFVLAFTAYGIPSVLIGATVPAMARLASGWSGSVGIGFGRFYTVNTIGAVLGAAAAGFLLIRTVGVQASLYAAAAGNATAALVAMILSKTTVAPPPVPVQMTTVEPASEGAPYRRFALAAAAAAGAVGLAYEVAWTRLLAIYTLNSVYVFTMVVTVYLAALAIGAGFTTRLIRSARTEPLRLLMGVQVALAFLGPILLALVPAAARLDLTQPGRSETDIFVREYLLAGAIVFLPTLLIGMTLPLLVAMLSSPLDRAGRSVGTIYAWNSIGTIFGSAVTGVALIPLIGLRGTLLLLAGCNFAIASAAALRRPAAADWSRAVPTLGAAAFVFLVALVPPVAQFHRPVTGVQEQLLYYAEGPSATVHVSEISGSGPTHRRLFVDSESVAGTYPEIVTDQKMLAHVPLLLHPAPRRALTVGFGTGGTSYSMLLHGVRVDCVEIEPKVPEACELFASENRGMVGPGPQRGGFRLVLDDARAWLHVTPEPYDVIVTDVTSIQYRGNGNLFTTDYFRLMRDDLTDDGLGCAWAPLTGVTPAQLKILIGSFREVFPHTSVWYMLNLPTDFVILVGTPGPLAIDLESMGRRMQRPLVQRDLATMGFDSPFQLLACLLLAEDDVAAYVGHAPLHTDDRPILDYLTHATAYRRTLVENLGEMLLYRTNAAQYVSAWPAGVAPAATGPTGRTAPALWSKWNQAAAHLIAGHIAAVGTTDDAANLARQAYESAAALLPDDPIIKGLLRPSQPQTPGDP